MHDSDNDKSSELSKMKAIFENCYLAIAAADGEDCSSGLFIPRPSSGVPDVEIEWNHFSREAGPFAS